MGFQCLPDTFFIALAGKDQGHGAQFARLTRVRSYSNAQRKASLLKPSHQLYASMALMTPSLMYCRCSG